MKSHLHVELVTETYPPEVNGVALTVQSLETGLRALGHRVALIRTAQPGDVFSAAGEDVVLTPGAPLPNYPGLRFGMPAGRKLAARWAADRPDAIYVATEGPLGWSALNAATRLGIPVATGFHTRFDTYAKGYGVGFLSPLVFSWLRRFHNRADATLVPTLELREQLAARGFRQVRRLARAVDTRQFNPAWRSIELRRQWGLADDDLAVLSVGRLAAEKNLDLTLRAFRALQWRHPRAKLVLVGDGPQRQQLQAYNPDVIFAGTQRGASLSEHYASSDLFMFSSLSETFGNVTLEAMASGLPSVAFDYGAAREHLQHRAHGDLVAFGDDEGFITACKRMATCVDRRAMGTAAHHSVQALQHSDVARDFSRLLIELATPRSAAA